jgi:hypothetical protein
MNKSGAFSGGWAQVGTLLLLSILLNGCATTPKIDWNSRVGTYSYDQTVLEFGPPDKLATLTDGTKVAEWLTSRGYSQGFITTFGPEFYHPYIYGAPGYFYSGPPSPDRYMRLTFRPDGRLLSWQKVMR